MEAPDPTLCCLGSWTCPTGVLWSPHSLCTTPDSGRQPAPTFEVPIRPFARFACQPSSRDPQTPPFLTLQATAWRSRGFRGSNGMDGVHRGQLGTSKAGASTSSTFDFLPLQGPPF
eukprot:1159521-Pelagomonas_calceolata.AAC.3